MLLAFSLEEISEPINREGHIKYFSIFFESQQQTIDWINENITLEIGIYPSRSRTVLKRLILIPNKKRRIIKPYRFVIFSFY